MQRQDQDVERRFGFPDASVLKFLWLSLSLQDGRTHDILRKIYSLPLVPITIVLWSATSECPASATFLFDSSANDYLSAEQVVMLSELTLAR